MPRPSPDDKITPEAIRPIVTSDRAAHGGPLSGRILWVLLLSLALAAIVFFALMVWWFNTPLALPR